MLELKNVSVSYDSRKERYSVNDASLKLENGKLTAVIGPNGSGKSTLLKAACGLLAPVSGEIAVDGRKISDYSTRELALHVSYLAQSRNIPDINAEKMVLHGRFPYLSYPRRYGRKDYEAADQAMKRAGAEHFKHKNVQELSGGERQKVYIAMLLAQDCPNVLMDEPAAYLDISSQLELSALARELAGEGRAVGIIMHDIPMALKTADSIVVVNNGSICFYGTPEEVYASGILEQVFGVRFGEAETADGRRFFTI